MNLAGPAGLEPATKMWMTKYKFKSQILRPFHSPRPKQERVSTHSTTGQLRSHVLKKNSHRPPPTPHFKFWKLNQLVLFSHPQTTTKGDNAKMNIAIDPRTNPTNRIPWAHVSWVSPKTLFKNSLILILSVFDFKTLVFFWKYFIMYYKTHFWYTNKFNHNILPNCTRLQYNI